MFILIFLFIVIWDNVTPQIHEQNHQERTEQSSGESRYIFLSISTCESKMGGESILTVENAVGLEQKWHSNFINTYCSTSRLISEINCGISLLNTDNKRIRHSLLRYPTHSSKNYINREDEEFSFENMQDVIEALQGSSLLEKWYATPQLQSELTGINREEKTSKFVSHRNLFVCHVNDVKPNKCKFHLP